VHAHVKRGVRKTCWYGRGNDDWSRKHGKVHVCLRHRCSCAGNPDRVVTRITGFDADAREVFLVLVSVVIGVRESGRRAVVMLVGVRGRPVLMLGVIVPSIGMHMRRRDRGRRDRDAYRKHKGQKPTHDDESTTPELHQR
jgi:hypothetical protein